jgi:aryl-alcohol dehydrogenase-like predicted oxidoreductase
MALRDIIDHSPRRRRLLRGLLAGTAAAAIPGWAGPSSGRTTSSPGAGRAIPPETSPRGQARGTVRGVPDRIRRDGMIYRRLGRSGLLISEIVLGGSPLPDWTLLRTIVEAGVNYIDTSESYDNGNSERLVGRLFKEAGRDKVMVHTRFHLRSRFTAASIRASVEASQRRLGTDHVDILGIHGVEDPAHVTDPRVNEAFETLKARGAFRFRGLTCHSNHHKVIPAAVECGLYDMVQFGYNVFDIQETERDVRTYGDYLGESGIRRLIDLAHGRDVGVIGMKVLKVGGRRQDLAKYRTGAASVQQAMLKWALENEKLSAVVTEILNRREMEEDLGAVGQPLAAAERRALYAMASAQARGACHMCGSCQSACPAGVPAAAIMRCLVYEEAYGKPVRARSEYGALVAEHEVAEEASGQSAGRGFPPSLVEACRSCGQGAGHSVRPCDRACPYGIPVRDRILQAAALLG